MNGEEDRHQMESEQEPHTPVRLNKETCLSLGLTLELCCSASSAQVFPVGISPRFSDYILNNRSKSGHSEPGE